VAGGVIINGESGHLHEATIKVGVFSTKGGEKKKKIHAQDIVMEGGPRGARRHPRVRDTGVKKRGIPIAQNGVRKIAEGGRNQSYKVSPPKGGGV